ncbi:MAG: hypothetical protein ABJO01_15565 [Parasphingorhabdus sp.]|uniref:hypothetical protein n=1 Tax=Parasphingorhabdus sp. TaxID=2709688 RepID=UPI00329821B2
MKQNRNRPLVLHNEGSRHPFRLRLPREIFVIGPDELPLEEVAAPAKKGLSEDASLFMLSFSAFFAAFYLFIF